MPTTFVLDDEEEAEQDVQVAQLPTSPFVPKHRLSPTPTTSLNEQPSALPSAHAVIRHSATADASEYPAATLLESMRQVQNNQQCIAEAEQLLQDLLQRSTALVQAQRRLEQRAVLAALTSSGHLLGCHDGRPVAALLIHRCLLHWRVFEGGPEAAALVDRLLAAMMTQGAEEGPQSHDRDHESGQEQQQQHHSSLLGPGVARLAYWLASSSTLLALLTRQAPRVLPPVANAVHQGDAAGATPTALDRITEMQRKTAGWAKGLLAKISAPSAAAAAKLPAAAGTAAAAGSGDDGAGGTGDAAAAAAGSSGAGPERQPSAGEGAAPGSAPAAEPASAPPALPSGQDPAAAPPSAAPPAPPPPATHSLSPQLSLQPAGAAVEAFRQQLAGLTLRQYSLLRDAFKRQLAALLPACVQRGAGVTSPGSRATSPSGKDSRSGAHWDDAPHHPETSGGLGLGGAAALRPWADLVLLLSGGLVLLQEEAVPRILIKCLLKQLLAFIDVQMFNQMLLRPECCAASNAHFMAEGLAHLDAWLGSQAGNKDTSYLAALQADLRHTRQAVCLLVHPRKCSLSCHDITRMCKSLSLQQLYRLCTTFWDDLPPTLDQLQPQLDKQQQQQQQEAKGQAGQAEQGQAGSDGAEGDNGSVQQAGGEAGTGPVQGAVADAADATSDALGATSATVPATTSATAATPASTAASEAPPVARGLSATFGGLFASVPSGRTSSASEGGLLAAAGRATSGPLELESGGMVSGEVLEELKSQSQVSSNGGLIVTFLLDEDLQPIIATRPAVAAAPTPGTITPCAVAYEVLYLIDSTLEPPGTLAAAAAARAVEEGHGATALYRGFPVPQHLLNADTPREPFLFLEEDVEL